jgi:diaminopimelate epimerase
MQPAVYVYAADTFFFETSCGSGSAALACLGFDKLGVSSTNSQLKIAVEQPGGVINACVTPQGKAIKNITISGIVRLSEESIRIDF